MQSIAIQIQRCGGPEVLEVTTVNVEAPGPGEVQLRQTAIGLNFADVYQRRGSHGPHQPTSFPLVMGGESAGEIEAVGSGVTGFQVGQKVACLYPGAYQAVRNVPQTSLIRLPDHVSDEVAGATMVRGLTAEYLLRRLYVVKPGDPILIHSAAGGMGLILSQWARSLGAFVIGTVGADEKRDHAMAAGCHHVINYRSEDFAARTLELTEGKGVAVVYDGVGKDVFFQSLECMRPLAMAINYGTASGDVEGLNLNLLHAKSLIVARPTLRTFISTPADIRRGTDALFDAIARGMVSMSISNRYKLRDAQRAHADLENRATTGVSVLLP